MIRMHSSMAVLLLAILLSLTFFQTHAQSHPPEEILKWEQDIAVFDSLNLVEASDAGTLLVTGSSSIRMWDSIHSDLAPYRIMQRGYGGSKLTDYNYYVDRIIKPHRFKAIVIFIANDISGNEEDRTPQEMFQLFKVLVTKIRERNAGTPICWIETTPTPARWQVNDQARQANSLIRDFCERNDDLHFIATYDNYITLEELPDSTFFREDMLHMNREGYLRWTEIIKASLDEADIEP